jgi:hypothetical protein
MGNNQMVLLQFPSTHYFFASLWDENYGNRSDQEVLLDVAQSLYPEHKELIANAFLALRETDPQKVHDTLTRLETLIGNGDLGKPGALGHYLFPNRLTVANDLVAQLHIRFARQNFIQSMQGKTDRAHSMQLVEDYFDKLLAWNEKTGWDKLMDEGSATPIYDGALLRECGCQDKELARAMSRLKQVIFSGSAKPSYSIIHEFFETISQDLRRKYSENSVMIGCIQPFQLAVIQTP